MNVVVLILHGLFAVALLGALSHQLVAACWPARPPAQGFTTRAVKLDCTKPGYRLMRKFERPPLGRATPKTPIEVYFTLERILAE